MSSDDYIHVDDAVEIVLDNGWLTEIDIAEYIAYSQKEFIKRLQKLLEERGFKLIKDKPKINVWECTLCGHREKTVNDLRQHFYKKHPEVKYLDSRHYKNKWVDANPSRRDN